MGGSQQDLEEDARAAACVAADPVFSALDASGAPIVAAGGDPLRIAFLNESARAVFGEDAGALAERLFRGDDPGPRRLAELVGDMRCRPGLRLERLRFRVSGLAQTITFLCRSFAADSGDFFVIAALGVRADSPAQEPRSAEARVSDETTALRRSLAARHGARSPRFLWKTDAAGRFTDVSHGLADVVGEKAADVLGRSVQDASQALALDAAFARAVASRRAWSGVEVEWPFEGDAGCVPTTLGARQMTDSAGRFLGYQGYGVLRINRARAADPTAATGAGSNAEENAFEPSLDNVVMLRPPASERVDVGEALSSSERLAFDEIARALTEGDLVIPAAEAAAPSELDPDEHAAPTRRNLEFIAPGPEQSALALARTLEEKLARAKFESALLGAAFDLSRAPLAIVAADGKIVRANAPFSACLATEATALESRDLTSFFTPTDAQILSQLFSDVQPHARARVSLATAPLRGSVPVDLILRRVFVDGRPMMLVSAEPWEAASADDRALEAARLAAESANAAKSDFLTRVSHEIRTPLNAIMGFAEVMMEERLGPIGSPRYKEYLKDIRASGAHVLSLVNDLLDLSKIEAGKMELSFSRVDANATIAECASIMQAQANQGRVVMRLALAAGLPPLRADARSLKQILLNLLSNAVKFNEPGGQVIVSSALNDAGSVVIRVKDTGIGMSEADVATALEPFRQVGASRRASGTGLGLPLTKALIEANHASFSIKSRHNEGTLIEIAFPPPQALAAE
ncbi:two-component sensor histidine kinase [Methylocystis sp. MitZ-2018]|nr:two-component sensor histidine kinase [Methylocystis sp. MitZ-2018]